MANKAVSDGNSIDKKAVLRRLLIDAICETVEGAKVAYEGPMYAAFMAHGCTLEDFNSYVAGAVATGRITKSGNVLRVAGKTVSDGRDFGGAFDGFSVSSDANGGL